MPISLATRIRVRSIAKWRLAESKLAGRNSLVTSTKIPMARAAMVAADDGL